MAGVTIASGSNGAQGTQWVVDQMVSRHCGAQVVAGGPVVAGVALLLV